MKARSTFALLVPILVLACTTANAAVEMVRNGEPAATIVEPSRPPEKIHKAATELQSYVKRMTGVTLPIVTTGTEAEGNLIVLGTKCAECPLGPGEPFYEQVGYDGFILRTAGNKVIIASRVDTGTLYAAYALLEELGCRFYFPHESGEVVPQSADLTVPDVDIMSKPAAVFRGQFWSCAPNFSGPNSTWYYFEDWRMKNRVGGREISMGHIFEYVVPAEKYFDTHPEYFPERVDANGKRQRVPSGQLCVSNPDVIRLFVGYCRNSLDQYPQGLSASISENDWGGWCECEQCVAWDGPNGEISRRQLRFANAVAQEVAKTHPGKYVACYGLYLLRELPPPVGMKAHPNVLPVMVHTRRHPRLITDESSVFETQWREYYQQWTEIADQLVVYDWYVAPGASHITGPNVQWLLDHKTIGYLAEVISSSYIDYVSYYICARTLWDRNFDWEAALEEFYTKFYGPAAEPLRVFYETLAEANAEDEITGKDSVSETRPGTDQAPLLRSQDLRDELRRRLDAAAELAGEDPYRRRVELMSECLQAIDLYAKATSAYKAWQADPTPTAAAVYREAMNAAVAYTEQVADEEVVSEVGMLAQLEYYQTKIDQGGANPDSARSQPGWNDEATFGDLWDEYDEVEPVPLVWKFCTDPKDEGQEAEWFTPGFDDSKWQEMAIAEFWEVQGHPDYDGYAWYRVKLPIPADAAGKQLLLYFGAVDEVATVYLNGQLVGEHDEGDLGWDKRFSVDITEAARPGEDNLLAVRVFDSQLKGGIWKSVKLVTPIP